MIEKDTPISSHFVGVLAAIKRESASSKTLLFISDCSYCMNAKVKDSTDMQCSDGQICRLIKQVKLFPGLKIRFVSQGMTKAEPSDRNI